MYKTKPFQTAILIAFTFFMVHQALAQEKDSLAVDSVNLNKGIVPRGDIREANPVITGVELVNADFPGSWPMFGSDLRMKIGGYVKADLLYDFDGTLDRTQFLMSTIPVEGQPEFDNSGYINLFSRETRFNFDVRTTKGKVPIRVFVEGDFFDNSTQFRLRHAYISVGNFIIGQTWTTLSVLAALPFQIDFAAGDALFGGRTTQVRFQKKWDSGYKLAMALERLDYLGIENPDNLPGEPSAQLPLFALRLDRTWETGLVVLGTSIAQLRWDGGANPNPTALQYSLLFAGRQYIGKNNYFSWNANIGRGNGENIMAFIGSNANAVLASEQQLETMISYSFLAGFMHKWSDSFSSNFSYAYGWLDTPPSRDPFALKRGGVGHVNLIYTLTKNLSAGVEFMHGAQRTANDALGRASRIQTMAKFQF